LLHGAREMDKPGNASGLHRFDPLFRLRLPAFGDLSKAAQTCLIRHDKSTYAAAREEITWQL
jgi:hypothetical protein